MSLSDDPQQPDKFVFPAGTTIAPGAYLVLFADANAVTSGIHLGFALAEQGDRIVLGPSDDGGYYLIGMKQLHSRLFQEIDWSTECVFDETMARATETGAEVKLLPAGYDVDDPAVLRRLYNELLLHSSHDSVAPHTRKFLASVAANKIL